MFFIYICVCVDNYGNISKQIRTYIYIYIDLAAFNNGHDNRDCHLTAIWKIGISLQFGMVIGMM